MRSLAVILSSFLLALSALAQDAPEKPVKPAALPLPELSAAQQTRFKASLAFYPDLDNKDPRVRSTAIDSLGKVWPRCPQTVPRLANLVLNDPADGVRASAAMRLRECGAGAALAAPALAWLLMDERSAVVGQVSLAALRRHALSVHETLLALLDDPELKHVEMLLAALEHNARFGARVPVAKIVPLLASQRRGACAMALDLLCTLGPAANEAYAAVKELAVKKTPHREQALLTLVCIRAEKQTAEVVDLLRETLNDGGWMFETMAVARLGPDAAPLVDKLMYSEPSILGDVEYPAVALARIGSPVVKAVITALKDESPSRRRVAACTAYLLASWQPEALGDELLDALAALLHEQRKAFGEDFRYACKALESSGARGRRCEAALASLLNEIREHISAANVCRALGAIGSADKATLAALDAACKSTDYFVRMAALAARYEITRDAAPVLQAFADKLARDKRADFYILDVVAKLGPAAAPLVPELVKLLKDSNLRSVAADALFACGKEAAPAIAALIEMVNTFTLSVEDRFAALRCLGQVGAGNQAAIDAVNGALYSPSPAQRAMAALALLRLGANKEDALLAISDFIAGIDDLTPRLLRELEAMAQHLKPCLAELEDRVKDFPAGAQPNRHWSALLKRVKE